MKGLSKLNLKNKKYIIFDLDGTLVDSMGIWNISDQMLIEKYGQVHKDLETIQIDRNAFLHKNQEGDTYVKYLKYLIEKYNFSIKDYNKLTIIRKKIVDLLGAEVDFKPDVVELILKLKNLGFIIILATMSSQNELDIYTKKNKKMIKQMDIERTFDLILTVNDVENKKPHPEMFNKIVQYYNTTPNECLIIEDSYTGILASKNAGIEVINIYDKYADIDRDKINELTDYSIKEYKELIDLIDSL